MANPNELNPELGTAEDYWNLVRSLQQAGMGQILDVVPNHMGIADKENSWWLDVLENGAASEFATFFDINWNPPRIPAPEQAQVVLPILGDQYGRTLESGQLSPYYKTGAFSLHYGEFELPVAPESYAHIMETCVRYLQDAGATEGREMQELLSILTALNHLPERTESTPDKLTERRREKEVIKGRLDRLYRAAADIRTAMDRTLNFYNNVSGYGQGWDALDYLITLQTYRLAFWKVAAEEINYRRFFDVSELAALRMQDIQVFERSHRLLLKLMHESAIDGLRIDHPDGLWDPKGYFKRRLACDEALREGHLGGQDVASTPRTPYLVAEKILSDHERLREDWEVDGTTGYDFLNLLNGLFVERSHKATLQRIYSRFTGVTQSYRDIANASQKMVMLVSLASEINELGYQLKLIATRDRNHRDFTLNGLTFAVREIIACMPIYRTYIDPSTGAATPEDIAVIDQAVAEAKLRNPRTDSSLFDYIHGLLTDNSGDSADPDRLKFVGTFQQTTGPVMAKGVEDTAFYVYGCLLSLTEVGGNPENFGTSLTAFHRENQVRLQKWPRSLVTTSTHDTKRSEDVRARINVLSEIPREWQAALTRWSRLNGRKKILLERHMVPDRNEEYILYQTLLGAWPHGSPEDIDWAEFRARVSAFMLKALKEAKINTSWINPHVSYEQAVQEFVQAILDTSGENPFLDDFKMLAAKISHFGIFNSLSQVLLKCTVPGVPDIYQGNESWDLSLVDPDNRRPVDYRGRIDMLRSLGKTMRGSITSLAERCAAMLETKEDGYIKMYVTQRTLDFRQQKSHLFAEGSYMPLRGGGRHKAHMCAFARVFGKDEVVVVAPVKSAQLTRGALVPPTGAVWGDTWLVVPGPAGKSYSNLFTGELLESSAYSGKAVLPMEQVLAHFPVALLEREAS